MRLKLALLAAGLALTALPASAQAAYYGDNNCQYQRNHAQVGGAIIGGLLGGVLGSQVSARGHRGDGTAVGAGLGALVGAAAGGSSNCVGPAPYPSAAYTDSYPAQYPNQYPQDVYAAPPPPAPPPVYEGRVSRRHDRDRDAIYAGDRYPYNADNGDYARTECGDAYQITRLPDGSEIRKPVEACRETYHGGWTVRD